MNKRLRQLCRELRLRDAESITLHVLRHTGASYDYMVTRDIEGTRRRWGVLYH